MPRRCAIGESPCNQIKDGNEGLYINDDMDAAYLVEQHSKLRATIGTENLESSQG